MAAGYSQHDVEKLGDLSDVTAERVRELLSAKLQEQKRVFEAAKNARFGLLPGAKRARKLARKK
jgi:hypothetical protein